MAAPIQAYTDIEVCSTYTCSYKNIKLLKVYTTKQQIKRK